MKEMQTTDYISAHINKETILNKRENDNMKNKQVYLAGGIMSRGEFLAREFEYNELQKLGLNLDIYSPVKNKSINDKTNQTVESNNTLSTRIVAADMERLLKSDIVVAEYQSYALGTISEIAILYMMKQAKQMIDKILHMDINDEEKLNKIKELRDTFDKKVMVHSSDIRNTNIPEIGYKRSHSYNQFCLGLIEDVTEQKSIQDFEEILKDLKNEHCK